jgi:hypothetical protein
MTLELSATLVLHAAVFVVIVIKCVLHVSKNTERVKSSVEFEQRLRYKETPTCQPS